MSDLPINADELLEALLERGIVAEVSPSPGGVRTVRSRDHGIQIAHLRLKKAGGSPEKKLARFWRARVGNTALRLIAVADAADSASERSGRQLALQVHRRLLHLRRPVSGARRARALAPPMVSP